MRIEVVAVLSANVCCRGRLHRQVVSEVDEQLFQNRNLDRRVININILKFKNTLMIQDRTKPTERLTIRDEEEVVLIKKAIKLLLDSSQERLTLSQQMSAIEIYRKTQRALTAHGKDNRIHRRFS